MGSHCNINEERHLKRIDDPYSNEQSMYSEVIHFRKSKEQGSASGKPATPDAGREEKAWGQKCMPVGVSLHSKPSFSVFGAVEEPLLCGALCLQDACPSAGVSSTARAGTRLGLRRFPSPNPHCCVAWQEAVGLWLWGLWQRSPSPSQLSGKFRLS